MTYLRRITLYIGCLSIVSVVPIFSVEQVVVTPADTQSERIPAQKQTHAPYCKPKYKKRTNAKRRVLDGNPQGKTMSHMNIDELRCAKNRALKVKNLEVALKYMQKMIPLCNDLSELASLLLETADALFTLGSSKEASTLYQDFAAMYPGHPRLKYALYKAIACSYATVLIPERDQTATMTTIELAESFLHMDGPSQEYHAEVKTILQACYKIRFESEISIIKFYIHQKNIASAQKRIERIGKEQLPKFPAGERSLIEVECLLAQKKNDPELLLQKQEELSTKFPKNSSVHLASNVRRIDHLSKF